MAGMIQEQTKHSIYGLPGPDAASDARHAVHAAATMSTAQTELMVIVTPYIARAVAQKDLSRPDDGFDPSDPAAVLLGRLNKIYGAPVTQGPTPSFNGKYGFILD